MIMAVQQHCEAALGYSMILARARLPCRVRELTCGSLIFIKTIDSGLLLNMGHVLLAYGLVQLESIRNLGNGCVFWEQLCNRRCILDRQ
jgi:hypothetical protein